MVGTVKIDFYTSVLVAALFVGYVHFFLQEIGIYMAMFFGAVGFFGYFAFSFVVSIINKNKVSAWIFWLALTLLTFGGVFLIAFIYFVPRLLAGCYNEEIKKSVDAIEECDDSNSDEEDIDSLHLFAGLGDMWKDHLSPYDDAFK